MPSETEARAQPDRSAKTRREDTKPGKSQKEEDKGSHHCDVISEGPTMTSYHVFAYVIQEGNKEGMSRSSPWT